MAAIEEMKEDGREKSSKQTKKYSTSVPMKSRTKASKHLNTSSKEEEWKRNAIIERFSASSSVWCYNVSIASTRDGYLIFWYA